MLGVNMALKDALCLGKGKMAISGADIHLCTNYRCVLREWCHRYRAFSKFPQKFVYLVPDNSRHCSSKVALPKDNSKYLFLDCADIRARRVMEKEVRYVGEAWTVHD